ncbi:MAG: guanylate kinase [Solobacterium sp.]|jgi:guanylate kinase|nr:guanylate kinase [Solobacterium sp.]MCH4050061.1 guanylate kinase [Solobacterium sp.]MCH4073746.1 guanylate kinase [Solobacterium sp.]MCI1313855.1 guanylate kinase [Solobacterium sp.]MCI1346534.1 guanylate kinase [Solobacterium sp.]
MSKGLLIVLSGPSGVGKGTVKKEFIDDPDLKLSYSVSMTTRKKRPGEVDGKDYYFVTKDEFLKKKDNGELLESAEFVGNYYGTPLAEVERLRSEGRNVLLEIEVQGCMQVMEKVPDAVTIFIVPPSMKELENRIRGRGTEPEEIVQQRLAKAEREMEMSSNYRYVVCNDDPKMAADIIRVIIRRSMQKTEEK